VDTALLTIQELTFKYDTPTKGLRQNPSVDCLVSHTGQAVVS